MDSEELRLGIVALILVVLYAALIFQGQVRAMRGGSNER